MKICIATERMRLGFGVDLVVDEQARRLVAHGYDVTVLVLHADLQAQALPYRLVVLNRFVQFEDITSPAALDTVRYQFELEDIDLWILQTPPFYDWARILDTPVIVIEYGSPPGHFFAPGLGRTLDAIVDRRLHDLYPRLLPCDAIVSISNYLHDWLPAEVRPKSTVAYLGGEHYGTAAAAAAAALRASLGIAPDDCLILWVGRIQLTGDEQPYKGLGELLALVELSSPHLPSARFVFVGRVSMADRHVLQQRGITVLPNLTKEEMGVAFAAADLLLNLARWEGFNLALVEAQHQGTPVLAYDIGPHAEVVANGVSGVLVDSPKALFTSLVELVTDRARRKALASEARAFAERFSWDENARQLVAIIERCMAHGLSRAAVIAAREKAGARELAPVPDKLPPVVADHPEPGGPVRVRPASAAPRRWRVRLPWLVWPARLRTAAREAARRRDLDGASSQYLQLVAAGRARVRDRVQLGHVLKEAGNAAAAADAYAGAAEAGPLDVDAQRQHGLFLVRLGRGPEAADVLARAIALDPLADDILAELARLGVADVGLLDEHILRGTLAADGVAGKSALLPRLLAAPSLAAARRSARRRDWRSAERHYRDLLRRDHQDGQARIRLGHVMLEQGQPEAALRCYRRALAADPRDPDAYLHLGHALKRIGRPESALAAYMTAWRLRPGVRAVLAEIMSLRPDLDEPRLRRAAAGVVDWQVMPVVAIPAPPAVTDPAAVPAPAPAAERIPNDAADGGPTEDGKPEYFIAKAAGITIAPAEEDALLAHAHAAGCDILFGDTRAVDDDGRGVVAAGRPFDHYAFVQQPRVGAAVAVRRDLAAAAGSGRQDLLTGDLLLRLVGAAHTVGYRPFGQATIGSRDYDGLLPTREAVEEYLALMDRHPTLTGGGPDGFVLRFTPASRARQTTVIVVDQGNVDWHLVAAALERIRKTLTDDRAELVLATSGEPAALAAPLDWLTRRVFASGTSYGEMANRAAEESAGGDALVFVDAGIAPAETDWLERLLGLVADPAVGAAAPVGLYDNGTIRHAGLRWLAGSVDYIDRFATVGADGVGTPSPGPSGRIRRVPIVSRHCLAIRRGLFASLGGFDEALSADAVDTALSCRLELLGLARLVDGGCIVTSRDHAPRWRRTLPVEEGEFLAALRAAVSIGPEMMEGHGLSTGPGGVQVAVLPPLAAR